MLVISFTSHSDKSRLSLNIAALVNNYLCYVGSRSTAGDLHWAPTRGISLMNQNLKKLLFDANNEVK